MLESELFALLEHTADAAYTVTSDGEICSWNTAAERLFGHRAADALGRNVDDVLVARDALGTEALAGGLEAAARHWDGKTGIPDFDLEVSTQPGERIWVNVSTIVFDNQRTGRQLFLRLARGVMQCAVHAHGVHHHPFRIFCLGRVLLHGRRDAAGARDLLHHPFGALRVDIGDDDFDALTRECLRNCFAEPGASSGDDANLSVEPVHASLTASSVLLNERDYNNAVGKPLPRATADHASRLASAIRSPTHPVADTGRCKKRDGRRRRHGAAQLEQLIASYGSKWCAVEQHLFGLESLATAAARNKKGEHSLERRVSGTSIARWLWLTVETHSFPRRP